MKTMTRPNAAGFTLVELVIIVGVISVVMVGATSVMPNIIKGSRADGSTAIVLNTLRLARDRAIEERRNMDVVFVTPNRIKIVREEISGVIPPPVPAPPIVYTTIMDVVLEGDQRFIYFTGTGDTGDNFGLTNKPLAFGTGTGTAAIMFTSEGTLVDSGGDAINGTVFLGTGSDQISARAVTIFGITALVRAWKWDGIKWIE
jgi:type II secretory pathway pseudopilin PulG